MHRFVVLVVQGDRFDICSHHWMWAYAEPLHRLVLLAFDALPGTQNLAPKLYRLLNWGKITENEMKWNIKSNAMEIAHHYLHESEHICIYTKPLKQLDAWVKHEIFNRRLTFLAKHFTHASRKEIKKKKKKTHINRNHNLLHSIVLWVCTNSLINFKCYQLKMMG